MMYSGAQSDLFWHPLLSSFGNPIKTLTLKSRMDISSVASRRVASSLDEEEDTCEKLSFGVFHFFHFVAHLQISHF